MCTCRLLLHRLPFDEDMRDTTLPSLDTPHRTPSTEQQKAALDLIDAYTLKTDVSAAVSASEDAEAESDGALQY